MRVLKALCCAAAMTVALAPSARADEWNKKTILTFSGPVQIPGATLPAGSYVFKLADIPGNRHVVQVFDKDEKKIYTTMLAIPNERLEPSDEPGRPFRRARERFAAGNQGLVLSGRSGRQRVRLSEEPGDADREGDGRVRSCDQRRRDNTPGTAGEIPNSMKTAELGRFDENGNWQSDNRRVSGERQLRERRAGDDRARHDGGADNR